MLHGLVHGPVLGWLPLRFNWSTARRFVAPCPPHAAWARLVPDPADPAAHYSGLFLGQSDVPGQPSHVIQRSRAPGGGVVETVLHVHDFRPPHRACHTYYTGQTGSDYGSGRYEISIRPHGRGSEVLFRETVHRLSIPSAFDLWFDDFGGEQRASMEAALGNRRDPTLWMRDLPRATHAEAGQC